MCSVMDRWRDQGIHSGNIVNKGGWCVVCWIDGETKVLSLVILSTKGSGV